MAASASESQPAHTGRRVAALSSGEAVARLVAFAATLLIARRLGPAAFGIIGVASGMMLYLGQLADQGIELVGVPVVARGELRTADVVSATLVFRVIAALLLAVVVALLARVFLPSADGNVLAAYAPVLVFTGASTRWVLLGLGRPGVVGAARVAGETFALAVVALAVHQGASLLWVPVSAVAGVALTTVVMLAGTWRAGMRLVRRVRWQTCRSLFERGRPLLAFTLLGLILFNFDLIFLRYVKGEAAAGEYAAAYAFISFASNLIVAFAHAVMPTLARTASGSNRRERNGVYTGAMAQVIGVTLPAAIGGAFVAGALLEFVFGDRFAPGAVALRWLALTLPFAAMREMAVVAVISAGGERSLVRVNLVTVVCNVVLNIALVPRYGLAGAAAATLATELVRLVLAVRSAGAHAFPPPSWRRYLKPLVAAVAMWAALQVIGPWPLWRSVVVGGVVYGVALALLGGLRIRRNSLPELTL